MSRRHFILLGIAVVAVALLGVAFVSARARREAEGRVAAERQRQEAVRVELNQEAARIAAAREQPAASTLPSTVTATPGGPAPAPKPPHKRAPNLMDLARENSGLLDQFALSKKAELGRIYGPLFHALVLSPEQVQRFKDILAGGLLRSNDIAAAADTQGLTYENPAIKKLHEESNLQTEAEIKALLGEAGFAQFKEHQRRIQVRGMVDGLASLVATKSPLHAQQADRLVDAMTRASSDYQQGKPATPKTVDWAAVDREAKQILTPEQYAIWSRGEVHNIYSGSRNSIALQLAYDAAIKAAKP